MIKTNKRTPKNYDGTRLTTHRVCDVLSTILQKISNAHQERPDLILAAWPDLIGPKLAPFTQAISFVEGVLLVHVKNSPLHSLLSQNERPRLLEQLRKKFPKVPIKGLQFRIG